MGDACRAAGNGRAVLTALAVELSDGTLRYPLSRMASPLSRSVKPVRPTRIPDR